MLAQSSPRARPKFHGRQGESASEYLAKIQIEIIKAMIARVVELHAADRVARIRFWTGLRGPAKDWWVSEYAGDRHDNEAIEKAFLERFSDPPSTEYAADMAKAASFERKRAETIHRVIRTKEAKYVLAIRLFCSLSTEAGDSGLQTRVTDQLSASGKVVVINGRHCLSPDATFNDVHRMILACANGPGETEDKHAENHQKSGVSRHPEPVSAE